MAVSMLIPELKRRLGSSDLEVVEPLLALEPGDIDPTRSRLEEGSDFWVCKLVSISDSKCPIEIHLGRLRYVGRINLYVGLGADLLNFESVGSAEARRERAQDVTRLLRSSVRAELHSTGRGVVRAYYYVDGFLADGATLRLAYKDYAWPPFRYRSETIQYVPWLASTAA